MATNRTRMRISYQQEQLLDWLSKQPAVMAAEMALAGCGYHAGGSLSEMDDLTGQTKSIKRALDRLQHWGLVRVFKAPHRDRDTDFWEEMEERMRQFKYKSNDFRIRPFSGAFSAEDVRAFNHYKSPVPRGNRQVDVVWAEITDAGREWLKARQEAA